MVASAGCFFRDFLGSLGAKYIGGNFQPIQPIRIQPVYYPAWILDAEVESYLHEDSEHQVLPGISRAVFIYLESCSELSLHILITGTLPLLQPFLSLTKSMQLCAGCDLSPPGISAEVDHVFKAPHMTF